VKNRALPKSSFYAIFNQLRDDGQKTGPNMSQCIKQNKSYFLKFSSLEYIINLNIFTYITKTFDDILMKIQWHTFRFKVRYVWTEYIIHKLYNMKLKTSLNPLNAELNPICYLLALSGAHHFLHVSRIRVKSLTLRLLMSYIYGAPILDVSRSHTTTHHSR